MRLFALAERWHLGQLVMATVGACLAAALGAGAFVVAADGIHPTTAQALGYAGANADSIADLEAWAHRFSAGIPVYPDSARAKYLVANGVSPDDARSLAHRGYDHEAIAVAALRAQGERLDFSARDDVNARKHLVAWASVLPPTLALVVVVVWWWRWFGRRGIVRPHAEPCFST